MFEKVLVANRGEIASRAIRTLQRLKIEAVAVYDDRERIASYVQMANASYSLGSGTLKETFLNGTKIIEIAKHSGCSAIYPGYGFLSENAVFAADCSANNIAFIGPGPETIAKMGNKIEAAIIAQNLGIPIIPQIRGPINDILRNIDDEFFPCLVKSSSGGGGKGMRMANTKSELERLMRRTSAEAEKYFGNGEVYIEKYLDSPRHIEVQVLADNCGNVVHLFERECSIQRRYQKIIEEAPAVAILPGKKEELYTDAIMLASQVEYRGAGTVEFLIDKQGNHFFLEMNTRIQVEHGITELITGIDIVEEQLAIAAGEPISLKARQATIKGHAIEARIYAEDPSNDFMPSTGTVDLIRFPDAGNIRIDTDICDNREVLGDFDPMIAKLMVLGSERAHAIDTIIEAVGGTIVHGVKNNLHSVLNIFNEPDFQKNIISTHYLEEHSEALKFTNELSITERKLFLAAGLFISICQYPDQPDYFTNNPLPDFWRLINTVSVMLDGHSANLSIKFIHGNKVSFLMNGESVVARILEQTPEYIDLVLEKHEKRVFYSWNKEELSISLSIDFREFSFRRMDFLTRQDFSNLRNEKPGGTSDVITAPLNGKVIKIETVIGRKVQGGDTLLVIESMKMENEIRLPSTTFVKEVCVNKGDWVKEGDVLVRLESKK